MSEDRQRKDPPDRHDETTALPPIPAGDPLRQTAPTLGDSDETQDGRSAREPVENQPAGRP